MRNIFTLGDCSLHRYSRSSRNNSTYSNSVPGRFAFTLIELLVVIAIIGLLAALLFPSFVRVQAKGRQTACASNLRQLSLGLAAYAQDNDECLPFFAYNNANHVGTEWQVATQSYIKNSAVWQCPDATEYATSGSKCRSFGLPYLVQSSSYSYNETAAASTTSGQIDPDGPTNGKDFAPAHLSQSGHPAQTFLFMDKGYGALFTPWTQWDDRARDACKAEGKTIPGPHNGGKNVAFADGHVRWLKREAIITRDQNSASGTDKDPQSPYFTYYAN